MGQHLKPLDGHASKIETFFNASLDLINSFEREFDRARFALADGTIVSLRDLKEKYRIRYPDLWYNEDMSPIVPGLSQEDFDWILRFQRDYDVLDQAFLRFGDTIRRMAVSNTQEIEV